MSKGAMSFHWGESRLWKKCKKTDLYLLCILEGKVREALEDAHDRSGHWGEETTRTRLMRRVYWPNLSEDVKRYIRGYTACARHSVRPYRTPEKPILTSAPFELVGMDFIGPLPVTSRGNRYILHLIEYFSSFSVAFATSDATVECVLPCLTQVISIFPRIEQFYVDPGHHFRNWQIDRVMYANNIRIEFRPTGASRSTGKVEGGRCWKNHPRGRVQDD